MKTLILDRDLVDKEGRLLLPKGSKIELSEENLLKFEQLGIVNQIKKVINRAKDRISPIKENSSIKNVFIKSILYFESKDKKIRIVTVDGQDFFYDRLENIMTKLNELTFYQIHKSYFVNLSHVIIFKYGGA
ncbi:LytR/AlgR family response regulator transcription factor [Oscillospiraceae bacterium LTW-04]|nr:LytTR family DNA-binding domain-containing protein [Oscillospiraceae bacterium MB24-C1]